MIILEMGLQDIDKVLPLYIEYYNTVEGTRWTEETAGKRIAQVLKTDDSYSVLMRDDDGVSVGFAMGYFKQYDDIIGYTQEEIVISKDCQGKGWGRFLLVELEERVRRRGASCIELQSVADEKHERYYGGAGYKNAKNFVMKIKWFEE